MFTLFSFFTFLTSVLSILLGVFVFYKNYKSKINIYLSLVCSFLGVWSFSLWMVINSKTEHNALFWQQILDSFAIFIPVLFLHFVLVFINQYEKKQKIRYVAILFGFIVFGLSFTDYFREGVAPIIDFNFWIVPGRLYFLFPLYFSIIVAYFTYLLVVELKKSSAGHKEQVKYILFSSLIGFIGTATNFLPQAVGWYPFGNFIAIFYIATIAYAITKYRLMNIQVVLRRYSVGVLSILAVLFWALLARFALLFFFENNLFFDLLVIAFAVSIYPYIKDYYNKIANRYFFTSLYDSRALITKLSEQMRSTLEIDKLYGFIFDALMNSLHIRAAGVLIYDKQRKEYMVQYKRAGEVKDFLRFRGRDRYKYQGIKIGNYLKKNFIEADRLVVIEDLKDVTDRHSGMKATLKMLNDIRVEVIIPLNIKDKKIGLLALGGKESRDIFNDEDLYVLNVIGTQTAIALENALLFNETKNFNVKLEKEVWNATKELIEANEKLKKLDQAKSEFISIASHQLRTPLTVIKGYISMILEGNFGEMSDVQKSSLSKVYQSNERFIQLVEDLLNISRIESGRLIFNFEDKNLSDMVASVVEELTGPAKKKGLKLEFERVPDLPKIKMDEDKLRQVVMNLTDNAIKYTKEGVVKVLVKKVVKDKTPTPSFPGEEAQKGGKQTFVHFCVIDNGMGIKPEDKVNLFKKFSRGTGTSLIHTEGTGLGLYVAKQMVESHNGYIWAESDGEGKGSKFCFEIPAVEKAE